MRLAVRYALMIAMLLGVCALRSPAYCQSPPKRALLVAVNGYEDPKHHPSGTSVHDLDTTPDVNRLRDVLKTRWKFQDNEIKVLQTPAETTHQSIVKAFREYLLDPALKGKGAVIFFHYSGHGSQWPDKADPTGLDQTLVPSDYKGRNDGSNDITDKEIAGLLKELNANQPASVFLSFDSCHSGTITRGEIGKSRGFERKLPAAFSKARGAGDTGDVVTKEEAAQWGYTVISACRSDQSDYQITDDKGKDMGSLSYALCRALSDSAVTATYRDVFNRVNSIMLDKVPSQEPQFEGVADQTLFSDKMERPDVTIGVYTRGEEAHLLAGFLMGVTAGTQLDLYPPDTKKIDPHNRIGTAVVGSSVDSTEAVIVPTLAPGQKLANLQGARAVITQRRYTDKPLKIDLSAIAGHPQETALRAALEPMRKDGLIEITSAGKKDWDLRLVPPASAFEYAKVAFVKDGADGWNVTAPSGAARGAGETAAVGDTLARLRGGDPTQDGSLTLQQQNRAFVTVQIGQAKRYAQVLDNDDKMARDVTEAVHRFATARMLQNLRTQLSDSFVKTQIQIVPCKLKAVTNARGQKRFVYDGDEPQPKDGVVTQFALGQPFYIKVQNTGPQPAYLTVLDLSSDGSLSALWPKKELGSVIALVPAGQKWQPIMDPRNNEILVWRMAEPMGNETIYAIATEKQTDFGPLLDPTTRGDKSQSVRGADNMPFGRLLRSHRTGTRSPDMPTIDPGDFALTDHTFTIVPVAKP